MVTLVMTDRRGSFVITMRLSLELTSRGGTIMVPMMASVLEETIWMVSASMGNLILNLKGTSRINVTACLHS